MRCTVELFGIARLRAARRAVEVRLGERPGDRGERGTATVADALTALAAACPALVGPVLMPDGRSLCTGYLLNRNGREFIDRTDAPLADGDCLLLIASAAGGGWPVTTAARRREKAAA
jgi:molybdopterin converting factor small subunit